VARCIAKGEWTARAGLASVPAVTPLDAEISGFAARDYYRHLDWHITHLQTRLREVSAG